MLFDKVLEQKRMLRVFWPAEARQSRVSQGTVIYDLIFQKGLRPAVPAESDFVYFRYLRPDISKKIGTFGDVVGLGGGTYGVFHRRLDIVVRHHSGCVDACQRGSP